MRRIGFLSLVLVACLLLGGTAQASPTVLLDGEQLEVRAEVQENRTLVPLRVVFEALDAVVHYEHGVVSATRGQATVKLVIGAATAHINGQQVTLDVPATIIGERTMVPLRFVSEALGCEVEWSPVTRIVEIRSKAALEQPSAAPAVGERADFDFNLFAELVRQDAQENVLVSPLSVYLALSMVYNGADGETREAMARVLGAHGISTADLNRANAALLKALNAPNSDVQLDVANSVWARQDVSFVAEFLETVQRYYGAQLSVLDFNDPGAPAVINRWVEESTNGKIDGIIDEIRPDDVMFLINAIYFLGTWTTEFDKDHTRDRPFRLAGGSTKDVPMMWRSGEFRYLRDQGFEAVELPYGKDKSTGMYVFLPALDSTLDEFYRNLGAADWTQWMDRFAVKEGSVSLPRFSIEYEKVLNSALANLGMEVAFQPHVADFTGLFTPPPHAYIGQVKHRAVVEVDEKGTEAAAVTSVEIRVTSAPLEDPFNMVVDRPFFFAIVDNQTGNLLFMCQVVNP